MTDQPSSGLHNSAESRAFSPVSALAPLLLCAGQKEGVAAKLHIWVNIQQQNRPSFPTSKAVQQNEGLQLIILLLAKRL